MPAPGVGFKPEAILHKRFRSLAIELEASSDAARPASASAAPEKAEAPGTSGPTAEATPGAAAGAALDEPSASAAEAPTPMAVDEAPAEAAGQAGAQQAAAGSGREEQQRRILDHILDEVIYSSRAEARSCCARVHVAAHVCMSSPLCSKAHALEDVPIDVGKPIVLQADTASCVWLDI